LVNALLGVFYILTSRLNLEGPLSMLIPVLQMLVLVGLFLTINRVVKFLKERITYPRTGYVAYRKPTPSTRLKKIILTAIIAAGVGALVGGLAAIPQAANRMPLVISVIMACTLIYIGYRFSLARLYIVATLTILWGFIASRFLTNDVYSTGAFFTGYGLLILLSGAVTLFIYLRRTHPAEDDGWDTTTFPENKSNAQ
jgi:hypothetical protein